MSSRWHIVRDERDPSAVPISIRYLIVLPSIICSCDTQRRWMRAGGRVSLVWNHLNGRKISLMVKVNCHHHHHRHRPTIDPKSAPTYLSSMGYIHLKWKNTYFCIANICKPFGVRSVRCMHGTKHETRCGFPSDTLWIQTDAVGVRVWACLSIFKCNRLEGFLRNHRLTRYYPTLFSSSHTRLFHLYLLLNIETIPWMNRRRPESSSTWATQMSNRPTDGLRCACDRATTLNILIHFLNVIPRISGFHSSLSRSFFILFVANGAHNKNQCRISEKFDFVQSC